MADLNLSYVEWFSRNGNNSDSNLSQNNKAVSIIFTIGLLGIVFIAIIIASFRVFRISYMNRRLKNQRQTTRLRDISSLYVVPLQNNIIPSVIEEPPPSYDSVVQSQERESDPTTRF